MESVLAHSERAAAVWGAGGRDCERISELSADALTQLADRLLPQSGEAVLGGAFELRFETGTTTLRMPDGLAVWEVFAAGFGPTKTLVADLDEAGRERLKDDFVAFHEQYRGDLGIAMPRDYLVAIGQRE